MGYCFYIEECDFLISKENIVPLVSYLKQEEFIDDADYRNDMTKLVRLFIDYGFEVEVTDDYDEITSIEHEHNKLVDQKDLLVKIAPYVKDNSYIQCMGEDGSRWRWKFKDKKLITIEPTITWED